MPVRKRFSAHKGTDRPGDPDRQTHTTRPPIILFVRSSASCLRKVHLHLPASFRLHLAAGVRSNRHPACSPTNAHVAAPLFSWPTSDGSRSGHRSGGDLRNIERINGPCSPDGPHAQRHWDVLASGTGTVHAGDTDLGHFRCHLRSGPEPDRPGRPIPGQRWRHRRWP